METSEQDTSRPQKVIPYVGTAVRGARRFPRPELEAEFDSALTRTNGGRLFGLRRTGKSSEAVACAERLRTLGKKVIEVDAQGKTSEADLLYAILGQIQTQSFGDRILQAVFNDTAIASGAREALRRFSPASGDVQAYFAPISGAIQRALQTTQEEVVLMVDELPWVCRSILQADAQNGRNRVDVLLAALRGWRNAGMKMLLLGSIGLVGLGREYRLDLNHLNDLTPLTVPPLEPDEAAAFIPALVAGGNMRDWTDNHTRALLDESVALYASVLQRGFEKVSIGGKAAALDRFPDIFALKVRPDLDSAFFQQFDNRVRQYRALGDVLALLLPRLLETTLTTSAAIARTELKQGIAQEIGEADLSDALNILQEDGFLTPRIEKDGRQTWSPASTLVTAWWHQRRGGIRA